MTECKEQGVFIQTRLCFSVFWNYPKCPWNMLRMTNYNIPLFWNDIRTERGVRKKCPFLFFSSCRFAAHRSWQKKKSKAILTQETQSRKIVCIQTASFASRTHGLLICAHGWCFVLWPVARSTIYIKFYTSDWFIVPSIKAKHTLFSICGLQARCNNISCCRSKSGICLNKSWYGKHEPQGMLVKYLIM